MIIFSFKDLNVQAGFRGDVPHGMQTWLLEPVLGLDLDFPRQIWEADVGEVNGSCPRKERLGQGRR